MCRETATPFATSSRIHLALAVGNLERSVAFYEALFGQAPSKSRPKYAKFEVAEPPVNLALNEVDSPIGPRHRVAHYGIEVKSLQAVSQFAARLMAAGLVPTAQETVSCCYAVQNKIWASDPDGHSWEVYVVLDNDGAREPSSPGACCDDAAGIMENRLRGVTATSECDGACGCAAGW